MPDRKYYNERHSKLEPDPMDLPTLKRVFLNIYQDFKDRHYFQGAMGKNCTDKGLIPGDWGHDIQAFFYQILRKMNIWPIEENIEGFDEPLLFTIIEFLHDYISYPEKTHDHTWHYCGVHVLEFDKEKGQKHFRQAINKIIMDYDTGYKITKDGEIVGDPPSGLESLVDDPIVTPNPENIEIRVQTANLKYRKHNATLEDKKAAIIELAGVLEYLRKSQIKFPRKDDATLFQIMNEFDLRHNNKVQHSEYSKDIWYNWFFYTFLASISTLIKLNEEFSNKT